MKCELYPVSYTHLDVYKRQGYYLSNDPAEAEVLRKIEMARIASIVGRTYGLSEMIRKAGRS